MSERGQVAAVAVAGVVAVLLGLTVLVHLARISAGGGQGQTAADMAALAAARRLAAQPGAGEADLRAAAAAAARANGAGLASLRVERAHGVPSAVDVSVTLTVDGELPVVGTRRDVVTERARAGVGWTYGLPAASFRPVALGGVRGAPAAVAAAEAQVGWPYVWGGESRAEGGFDCSGLVDHAYSLAGMPLPGRPTAADLWRMSAPVAEGALAPGDLVFLRAPEGAPYHVGMYVGGGTVVVAPHTGASVRYEPLAAGGWDGFGRLAAGPPVVVAADPAVEAAARAHQVPPHVLTAEVGLGLATDPDAAAAALAAAQRRHPGDLPAALADALGSRSAAALVLDRASGPVAAGGGLAAGVRLLPVPPLTAGGGAAARAPAGGTLVPAPTGVRRSPGGGWLGRATAFASTAVAVVGSVADHVDSVGRRLASQGEAGLHTGARVGLTIASVLLPRQWEQDAASTAGSVWDAVSSMSDLVHGGLPLEGWGVWAARASLAGSVFGCGLSLVALYRSRTWSARIFNGAQAIGYGLTAAGLGMGGLFAAGAVIPPLGLGLCFAGAVILAGSYCYRERRRIASAVGAVADAAGSALDAGRSAVSALNPFG